MSWELRKRLREVLGKEEGAMVFAPGSRRRLALVYPNEYQVGMSNLGLQIIYRIVNSRGDFACERFFLPDKKTLAEYERTNTPLLSLENQIPLAEFPLIAFAVSFEMDYFNMLKILALGKVQALAAERGEGEPLIIMGGPCATFNPEPLADFVDACVIGEGEEIIGEILDRYEESLGLKKPEILLNLAQVKGLYVPAYYKPHYQNDGMLERFEVSSQVPRTIKKRYVKNIEKYPGTTTVKTEEAQFKDMFLIETARGCGRHCRFCMAGHCFLKPRSRSLEDIAGAIKEAQEVYHAKRVGLVGAAVSDYEDITEVCRLIKERGLAVSTASLRADSLSQPLLDALAASGQKTITLAPEAASERLRRVINKNITDAHLENAVQAAVATGINNVRLYIMIGLPTETEADIAAIAGMAKKIKQQMSAAGSKGMLTLSINPFIPKPFTPFQWLPMAAEKEIEAKEKQIKNLLKGEKGIKLIFESTKEAYVQAILARGDRRLGEILLRTVREGINFRKGLSQMGLDENFYLYRLRPETEILPWHNLSMGFQEGYLYAEYLKSLQEQKTPPCAANCRRCGIC
ncbi:MAG: TIGR03960 family B12-binding radical SAM protein [Sporomusaceae bacterium]|nr:TIGR03960 family B12-binding radical SAM protein [Sporomusaceae bacterium]